ncbi:MAG: hypothetical protein KI785_11660 [Devosiaceae bacterium]|nr:hypothetical protein [Devosiaceae bacterium MH13]
MRLETIQPEAVVFAAEGTVGIGGVRRVDGQSVLIHIENYGELRLEAHQIKAIHDGKVILDVPKLPADVQNAIGHAHDRETE